MILFKIILVISIRESNAISILADLTKDKQNAKDLAIAARFVDSSGNLRERCFSIIKLSSANA